MDHATSTIDRESARLGVRRVTIDPPGRLWTTVGKVEIAASIERWLFGYAWREKTFVVRDPLPPVMRLGQWVGLGYGSSLRDILDPDLDQIEAALIEVGGSNSGNFVLLVDALDPDPEDPRVYAVDHDVETTLRDALVDSGLRMSELLARLEPHRDP